LKRFIEGKLRLKVNEEKSAMNRPWNRKFLGFSFYLFKGTKDSYRQAKYQANEEKSQGNHFEEEALSLEYRDSEAESILHGMVRILCVGGNEVSLGRTGRMGPPQAPHVLVEAMEEAKDEDTEPDKLRCTEVENL